MVALKTLMNSVPIVIVTFYWLLYRKMWLHAFLYLLWTYFLGEMVTTVAIKNLAGIAIVYVLYFVAVCLLPVMYANAMYYEHCKGKIKESSVSVQDSENLLKVLSEKGGVSKAALIFAIIVFICMIGIVAAIAIPAYQDYLIRAGG